MIRNLDSIGGGNGEKKKKEPSLEVCIVAMKDLVIDHEKRETLTDEERGYLIRGRAILAGMDHVLETLYTRVKTQKYTSAPPDAHLPSITCSYRGIPLAYTPKGPILKEIRFLRDLIGRMEE